MPPAFAVLSALSLRILPPTAVGRALLCPLDPPAGCTQAEPRACSNGSSSCVAAAATWLAGMQAGKRKRTQRVRERVAGGGVWPGGSALRVTAAVCCCGCSRRAQVPVTTWSTGALSGRLRRPAPFTTVLPLLPLPSVRSGGMMRCMKRTAMPQTRTMWKMRHVGWGCRGM